MWIRDLPIDQFYKLAGAALFGTPESRRWTKYVAVKRGDSCAGLVQSLYVQLLETDKDSELQPSTRIYNFARWFRCARPAEKAVPDRFMPLVDDRAGHPEQVLIDADARLLVLSVRQMLRTLTYRERCVIELRFGLRDEYSYSFSQIGKVLGVSRERIRQIEEQALNKLQHRDRRSRVLQYYTDYMQYREEAADWRKLAADTRAARIAQGRDPDGEEFND